MVLLTVDQWAVWVAWPVEHRRRATAIRDPAIVSALQSNVQSLWQMELQARGFGMCGTFQQFDHFQLPLLASMEFEGFSQDSGQSASCVILWPSALHEDPAWLLAAVEHGLGRRHPCKAAAPLPPSQCPRLLQSWSELELRLAQLVEQLVLRAAGPPSARARPSGVHVAVPAPAAAGEGLTARAAKRLRQRERRKLCKRGILGAPAGAGSEDEEEVAAGSFLGGLLAKRESQEDDGASVRTASTTMGWRSQCSGQEVDRLFEEGGRCVEGGDSDSPASQNADVERGWSKQQHKAVGNAEQGNRHLPRWGDDAEQDLMEPQHFSLDELEDALEELETRQLARQLSSSSSTSDVQATPPSRQVGCLTPTHLWPSTPDLSPRHGTFDSLCLPRISLPPMFVFSTSGESSVPAPGVWVKTA